VLRKGLKAFPDTGSDFDIVGETGDGLETVNLVAKLEPDILVLDLVIPGLNGSEVIRQLKQQHSRNGFNVLSFQPDEYCIQSAFLSNFRHSFN
jgi:DNA-binding NarL/FixJ family response regulator